MTFRAVEVLKQVDLILAEDTRTTSVLLKHYGISRPTEAHHKFNEHKTVEQIAARIKGGENIALVSDAGTPAISDPGFMLVRSWDFPVLPVNWMVERLCCSKCL